ncbi:MAG: AAA family ATPase [Desulfovibrio sp.]|nr:AAA family ATPase [Desulfovibrio sp.]
MSKKIIRDAYEKFGKIVVLIDEYDKPILDNISDPEKISYTRSLLHSFYSTLKACDKYIYFLFITGISRFTKIGIFSSINNLVDISFSCDYSAIVGYTQDELEHYFRD